MSAPESSNSKAPPSLLSDKAKGADGNGSRILANLEGRVAPPTDNPRRSKTPLVLVALLVIAAGGWAAWHMQQRTQTASLASATPANVEKAAAAASGAPPAVAKVEAPAAASSQAATIVADDSDGKAAAASAATPASSDENRLSRALADGAEPSSASALVASASAASAASVPAAKHGKNATAVASNAKHETAAHGKKENAGNHRESTSGTVAQSKKSRSGSASKDDSDADLLAALVARTKPADAKAAGGNTATKVSASAAPGNAKLAERVKECGQRGFFEDQLCRWRVCDGHWGKDPACPGSSAQARQP